MLTNRPRNYEKVNHKTHSARQYRIHPATPTFFSRLCFYSNELAGSTLPASHKNGEFNNTSRPQIDFVLFSLSVPIAINSGKGAKDEQKSLRCRLTDLKIIRINWFSDAICSAIDRADTRRAKCFVNFRGSPANVHLRTLSGHAAGEKSLAAARAQIWNNIKGAPVHV